MDVFIQTALRHEREWEMNKASVLLVDDDEVYLENLSKLLVRRGYDVMGAHDGPTAIGILEKHHSDVVLLDISMPGMDGIETLKEMKAMRPEVQVVMLTGHGDVASIKDALLYEAFDFSWKTLRIDEIIDRIDKAFRKRLTKEQGFSGRKIP